MNKDDNLNRVDEIINWLDSEFPDDFKIPVDNPEPQYIFRLNTTNLNTMREAGMMENNEVLYNPVLARPGEMTETIRVRLADGDSTEYIMTARDFAACFIRATNNPQPKSFGTGDWVELLPNVQANNEITGPARIAWLDADGRGNLQAAVLEIQTQQLTVTGRELFANYKPIATPRRVIPSYGAATIGRPVNPLTGVEKQAVDSAARAKLEKATARLEETLLKAGQRLIEMSKQGMPKKGGDVQ